MTSKLNGASDVEYICLFCPLPYCMSESKWCLFNRYNRLKRGEARARQRDREWLSERQVKWMLEEIGERTT